MKAGLLSVLLNVSLPPFILLGSYNLTTTWLQPGSQLESWQFTFQSGPELAPGSGNIALSWHLPPDSKLQNFATEEMFQAPLKC